VALAAVDPFMSTLELISHQPVIELLLIKTDHLELSAMVVVMARRTFLSLHFGGDMVPFTGFDPRGDFGVAVKALIVGDTLSQDMTFGTVGHPFQVCMGI
jgi:hypothetical protein